jgi:CRP/FNR family cyclic AMP-dependent transcriptional regulator
MDLHLDLSDLLGLLGVAFSAASFIMKRMLPLRVLAIFANILFIGYGLSTHTWPGVLLNCLLLPVNVKRIHEIRRLSSDIARANCSSPASEWLLPHMTRRAYKAGETVFRQGEAASRLIFVASGELELVELGKKVGAGDLLGEIGLFTPNRRHTQTVVCRTDADLYQMTDEMLFQVYYQEPKLGFYLVRLIAQRLLGDLERQRGEPQPA